MKHIHSAILLLALVFCSSIQAQDAKSYSEFVARKELHDGYFPILFDDATGKVFLVIPAGREEFIFQGSLPRGLGSNDVGLDRGQLGETRLVKFERVGDKVLLRQLNTNYRAVSENPAERMAVEQAFGSSVIWGFKVAFRDTARTIVDYTPFLLSDIHRVVATLKSTQQGDFKLDESRSAPYLPRTKAFPQNSELEATLTFTGDKPGSEVRSVAPEATSFSVGVHHSLIALPPLGYEPRRFVPYSGFWSVDYVDYAQPLGADLVQRYIPRHRLKKKDPAAARSEPIEPIVYYLDPGTPEPIRSALLDGARWWNQAFEAIGYTNAFQVRMLPDDVDPMDVRYNVIQWVHRSTRGWSYGSSVIDPRSGEIIKGHVTLGSLRVRQDELIAQGLLSPFGAANGDTAAIQSMALARLRQLAAHEVGHTLGISHNFAASRNNRASVMDYPHPRLRPTADGASVDISNAYGVGLGPWDNYVIAYGYSDVAKGDEARFLADLVARTQQSGLRYVTDQDSRSIESFNSVSALWDDGDDALAEFDNLLNVRRIALGRFGADSIPAGTPWSELAKVVVPVYYLHRYQVEAVAHLVGGVDFSYAIKGDRLPTTASPVSAPTQSAAVDALLRALSPEVLALDPKLVSLIAPPAYGYSASRENPPSRTAGAFDPVTLAEAAGEHVLTQLLAPARLARMQIQHTLDDSTPSNRELFDRLIDKSVRSEILAGLAGQVQQRINLLVVERMLMLAYGDAAVSETRSAARASTQALADWLASHSKRRQANAAHYRLLADMIDKATRDQSFKRRGDVAAMPPGSPI